MIEDFVNRYENVALAGMQYEKFAPRKTKIPPYLLNTRIYSCILIKNEIPYRWRGKYNEDTDLSLRSLKDNWCTILFQAFLCDKIATMTMKGGNTTELYVDDGRLKMAQSLVDQHPDITKITWKWGRWQHQVDYSRFARNKLRKKSGLVVSESVDNYGMILQDDEEQVKKMNSQIDELDTTEYLSLFEQKEWWEDEWKGMPEFVQEDLSPLKTIYVHFANREDIKAFSELVNQKISMSTKWIWFPEVERADLLKFRCIDGDEEKERSIDMDKGSF